MGVMMSAEPFPDWLRPPVGGWTAEDLDRLPDLPPHTELIDGNLVFVSPQANFHMRTIRLLEYALLAAIPDDLDVWREFSVVLGKRNRPEPDLTVTRRDADRGPRQTALNAEDIVLAVEVVSEESEERDREIKPVKYAAAGIRYFWLVESDDDHPVVHTYELDPVHRTYALTGIFHDRLKVDHPFPLDVDLSCRPHPGR
ncbi:Uma2 family endonuclease [Kitasatospora sp. NPDC006697]|uniref:Uma2 family endonuclease n=1 Tax=Kitasatospora sp. NPDC006697 TaxID=3364020 RepID=UPI0036ACBA46